MISNLFDEVLLKEVIEKLSSYGSVDLEFIDDSGNGKIQDFGCFLENSLVALLIEEDSVVNLFLYLYLGPTLLLCLSTSFLI